MAAKPNVTLAIMGPIDTGKSTLIGHLLYKIGAVSNKEMANMEHLANSYGRGSFKFAFILNRSKLERERCISINGTLKHLEMEDRITTFVDLPGHRDFCKNIFRNMSIADYCVLVVSAVEREFET